jgi:hypothetical protein
MLIAVLFIIAKSWNQPRCPPINEHINEIWYIYTMENYSAIKKNEMWHLQENGQNWK